MTSWRDSQDLSAPSTPSFSSVSWKRGGNWFMLVLRLTLSSSRQMSRAMPASDMANIGKAKYQSWTTKSQNADMRASPGRQGRDGGARAPFLLLYVAAKRVARANRHANGV